MKIEYIYPPSDNEKEIEMQLKQMQKENMLGCLVSALFFLCGLSLLLLLLPALLIVTGYAAAALAVYIVYKAWLEDWIFRLIKNLKNKFGNF